MSHKLTFQELHQLALSKRCAGILTMDFRELHAPDADSFVASLGFKPLGKAWLQIDRAAAIRSLEHVLYCDLAYQCPLMDQKTATFIAENFFKLFSTHNCRFLTNGSLNERGMLNWTPLSNATFDHGIVAFDDRNIGIIWVQDED